MGPQALAAKKIEELKLRRIELCRDYSEAQFELRVASAKKKELATQIDLVEEELILLGQGQLVMDLDK